MAVLLRVYAKCISGKDAEAKRRILDAMKPEPEPEPDAERPEGEASPMGNV